MFFDVGEVFGPVLVREPTFWGFEAKTMDCGMRSVWWDGWAGVVGWYMTEKLAGRPRKTSFRRPVGFWDVFVENLMEFWYQNGDLATIYMMGGVILGKKRSRGYKMLKMFPKSTKTNFRAPASKVQDLYQNSDSPTERRRSV